MFAGGSSQGSPSQPDHLDAHRLSRMAPEHEQGTPRALFGASWAIRSTVLCAAEEHGRLLLPACWGDVYLEGCVIVNPSEHTFAIAKQPAAGRGLSSFASAITNCNSYTRMKSEQPRADAMVKMQGNAIGPPHWIAEAASSLLAGAPLSSLESIAPVSFRKR